MLSTDELRRSADLSSWPSVFEAILRHHAPAPASSDVIWGDKSPSYLTDLPLLKRLYPGARVIHIVRDPRDQALSANEAWGKHVLRSAERWRRDVQAARTAGARLDGDYVEVHFEDLISQPEQTIERLCHFVDVQYGEGMTSLTMSHEDKGSAVGALRVVAGASGRHTSLLDATTIRRIDEIVAPVAHELGYAPAEPVRFRPLPAWRGALYRVHDGATITKSYFEDDGLRHSLVHLWTRGRASG